jgi:hypothetical protein
LTQVLTQILFLTLSDLLHRKFCPENCSRWTIIPDFVPGSSLMFVEIVPGSSPLFVPSFYSLLCMGFRHIVPYFVYVLSRTLPGVYRGLSPSSCLVLYSGYFSGFRVYFSLAYEPALTRHLTGNLSSVFYRFWSYIRFSFCQSLSCNFHDLSRVISPIFTSYIVPDFMQIIQCRLLSHNFTRLLSKTWILVIILSGFVFELGSPVFLAVSTPDFAASLLLISLCVSRVLSRLYLCPLSDIAPYFVRAVVPVYVPDCVEGFISAFPCSAICASIVPAFEPHFQVLCPGLVFVVISGFCLGSGI